MKQFASVKVGQVVARYGEHAPAATVCCNACRTCVTTNLAAALLVGVTGLAASARRLFRRQRRQPDPILGTGFGDRFGASQGSSGTLKEQVMEGRQSA